MQMLIPRKVDKQIVSVKTSNLVNHGNHLTIDVTYTIRERAKNYTHLERSETVTLPAPSGSCIVTFGTNKIDANYYNPFFGEDHNWYNISNAKNINNSYFDVLSIRFDGKGNDDTGNAQLDGTIAIPVKLRKCAQLFGKSANKPIFPASNKGKCHAFH